MFTRQIQRMCVNVVRCNSGKARIDILGLYSGLEAVNWIYTILGRVKIEDEIDADSAATTVDGGHQFGTR